MALKIGDKAPDFTLFDTDKKQRTLKELMGRKTVVAFYPGAFTGACSKEMCTLRDSIAAFGSLGASVAAISVDSPFANKAFLEANKLPFPLLSDYTHEVSKSYCGLYDGFAALPGYKTSKRSVFLLDSEGIVKYAWISENPGADPEYDEIKKALESF